MLHRNTSSTSQTGLFCWARSRESGRQWGNWVGQVCLATYHIYHDFWFMAKLGPALFHQPGKIIYELLLIIHVHISDKPRIERLASHRFHQFSRDLTYVTGLFGQNLHDSAMKSTRSQASTASPFCTCPGNYQLA